jgi:hypothetical protein
VWAVSPTHLAPSAYPAPGFKFQDFRESGIHPAPFPSNSFSAKAARQVSILKTKYRAAAPKRQVGPSRVRTP